MRKRRQTAGSIRSKKRPSSSLIIICAAFLLGVLFGLGFAGILSDEESGALKNYVVSYLSAVESSSVTTPSLFSAFWNTYQWPIGIFLCSLTVVGVLGIPFLLAARGFLLSFAVSCFIRVLGSTGIILSVLLFGLSGLFSLPALFLFGVEGLDLSLAISRRLLGNNGKMVSFDSERWLHYGMSMVFFWFSMTIERGIVPVLLHALAGTF